MTSDLLQIPTPIKKVLILGAECTGKTTLCQDLAAYFNTVWVGEYMRHYLKNKPQGYVCQYGDLLPIAIGQIQQETHTSKIANRYLFCDTALFELMVYAYWYFGRCPDKLVQAVTQAHYDLVLLTDEQGVCWVDDGLRDLPNGRADMRAFFVQKLHQFNIAYHRIGGDRQQRVLAVKQLLTP